MMLEALPDGSKHDGPADTGRQGACKENHENEYWFCLERSQLMHSQKVPNVIPNDREGSYK